MKPLPRDGRVILTIENSTGFASCYWDTPAKKIYPRDYWCKLGEAETDGGVN